MKKLSKLLMIALALVLILALVACDSENNGDETKSPADTNSQTNTPNDSDNVTDGTDGTQDPSDTSKDTLKDPSNDTSDAATGTNKPEQPTEPEDPDKTAKIVDSVNQAVEALASNIGGQTGSELPSVSLDSLVELFKKLDLEITGIAGYEGPIIIKNGMISYTNKKSIIDSIIGDPTQKYIGKLYSNGVVNIYSDSNGTNGYISSFEDAFDMDISSISSIDLTPVLNALKLAKDDIKADVEKQMYTFSESYLARVSKAIYDLVKSSGEQMSVLGVNENNVISSLVLDFGKFESEGKISATAKIGKTGKEIVLDLTVGDTNFEMSVECKDMFAFNMKLAGTQEAITSFELNAELSSANLKLAVKGNRTENTSFEATLSDLKSTALITVTGTSKTETNGKTSVNVEINIDVEKIGNAFGGSTEKLSGGSDSVKKVNIKIGCTVTPDANAAPNINVSASVMTDSTEVFGCELYVSSAALTTPSKECVSLNLLINGSQKLSASVKTVSYSEKSFEYQINIEASSGIGIPAKAQISIKAPSTVEIEITEAEKAFLDKADKVFENYGAVQKKIEELNTLAYAYATTCNPDTDPTSFYTVDKDTGLVYVTHMFVYWKEDSTYVEPDGIYTELLLEDLDEVKDELAENLGDFKNYKESFRVTATKEIESVLKKEFDALGEAFSYEKADYYVCCKDPDTDTYYVFECYMSYTFGWRTFDHKPTTDEIGSTAVHWYTLGAGKIHSFANSSTRYTCPDCGLSLMDMNSIWH